MPFPLSSTGPVKVPLCSAVFVWLSRAGPPSVLVLKPCLLWCYDARWAGDLGQYDRKKKTDPCCHAQTRFYAVMHLFIPLSSNVLYSACLPLHFKREYPLFCFSCFSLCTMHPFKVSTSVRSLQTLQSCKLQRRVSYTIMQNGTLSVNCSHAILNVRVPKHSLYTST